MNGLPPTLPASELIFPQDQQQWGSATTEQPLVSVCIPTYQDARFLHQSLSSIVSQTYLNLEILVGDDASTDNTIEVVQSF